MITRTLYAIPYNAPRAKCASCGVLTYMVTTAHSGLKVVDCNTEGTRIPTRMDVGEGVEHPAHAPARISFSRNGR